MRWPVLLYALGLFALAPLGATLKRRRFHQRHRAADVAGLGCLINPLLHASMMAVLAAWLVFAVLGRFRSSVNPGVFPPAVIMLAFACFGLGIANTAIVGGCFDKPDGKPRFAFLATRVSELAGDACLHLNMLLYQILRNAYASQGGPYVKDPVEFVWRLCMLLVVASLPYLPPRVFFLAEETHKRRAFLMMRLANLPVFAKVLVGTGRADW